MFSWFFFFNDTATTEIYTLSLHDALPICRGARLRRERRRSGLHRRHRAARTVGGREADGAQEDRKSTRLNSSHANISYAVFCLKKKKKENKFHLKFRLSIGINNVRHLYIH